MEIEYARRWLVDGKEFPNKEAAQRHIAEAELSRFETVDDLMTNADEVVALLKPFTTPRTRKPKASANGAGVKAKAGKPAEQAATA